MNTFLDSMYGICSYICHQNPERSFFINSRPFFLCARCTGIYLFIILTLLGTPFLDMSVSFKKLFLLISFVLLLNAVTLVEFFDTNPIRFIFGSMLGLGCGLIIVKSVRILVTHKK